jgi:hypothetical protein
MDVDKKKDPKDKDGSISSVAANGQFWKPPFPRVVSSVHKAEPERTVSNVSATSNDDEEEEEEEPTKNVYDTFGLKLLKIFFGCFMFVIIVIAACVNKEAVVFFSGRSLTEPTVFSYLLMIMLCPLIPVLVMDIGLRWVREKEKTWKAKQKVEKYVVRPAAVFMAVIFYFFDHL